jgi:hypothetical protein
MVFSNKGHLASKHFKCVFMTPRTGSATVWFETLTKQAFGVNIRLLRGSECCSGLIPGKEHSSPLTGYPPKNRLPKCHTLPGVRTMHGCSCRSKKKSGGPVAH